MILIEEYRAFLIYAVNQEYWGEHILNGYFTSVYMDVAGVKLAIDKYWKKDKIWVNI